MLRIVRNNLAFRFGEYEESELLSDLVVKDDFRATINHNTVCRAIVELYSSTKHGVKDYLLGNRIGNMPSFAMVVDFWSSKTQPGTKYLGLRVYLGDNQWKYRSVLLGTRHFEVLFGERCQGYRTPFKRWIVELLHNFGLNLTDFFGSTTDSGPEVKWMMQKGLSLKWVWCMSHLTNAATKLAFGIAAQRSTSKNIEMTDLISRISQTVYAIRSNESMGSLFHELCKLLQPGRILEKWDPLERWFEARREKAIRARKNPLQEFPLIDDKETLLPGSVVVHTYGAWCVGCVGGSTPCIFPSVTWLWLSFRVHQQVSPPPTVLSGVRRPRWRWGSTAPSPMYY